MPPVTHLYCYSWMTWFTKWHKITIIMCSSTWQRNYMMNLLSQYNLTFLLALLTQRMSLYISVAYFFQALPYLILFSGLLWYLSYLLFSSLLCSSQYLSCVSLGQPGKEQDFLGLFGIIITPIYIKRTPTNCYLTCRIQKVWKDVKSWKK